MIAFNLESRVGRTICLIQGDLLEMSRGLGAARRVDVVSLRTLSKDFRVVSRRLWPLILLPAVLGLGSALVMGWLIGQETEGIRGLAMYPGGFACIMLVLALRMFPRFELVCFNDVWGKIRLFLVREHKHAAECDEFLAEVVRRIEQLEAGEPLVEPAADPSAGISAARYSTGELNKGVHPIGWWWMSIICGLVAATFPVGLVVLPFEASLFFMLTVGVMSAGITCAVLSFLAHEPRRNWAILGVILSLVPCVVFWLPD